MKKFIFFLFAILTSQYYLSIELIALTCCDNTDVDFTLDTNCCLRVDVSTECTNMVHILFQKEDGATWSLIDSHTDGNNNVSFLYCPDSNETIVNFRIRLVASWDNTLPRCAGEPFGFQEGYTQYSYTANFAECCTDCPEGYEDWLILNIVKSNECPDYGCEVTHSFNIPEEIECITQYIVITDSSQTPPSPIPTGDTLIGINRCIGEATSYNVKVKLITSLGDTCLIDKTVYCEERRDTSDLPQPCTKDCFLDEWIIDETGWIPVTCPGNCEMKIYYAYRYATCYPFVHYQDLQIIRIETKNCDDIACSDEEIQKQAFVKLIQDNPMDFHPKEEGCYETWRLSVGSCWAEWDWIIYQPFFDNDTIRVREPCELTDCCMIPVEVCRDSSDNVTITPDSEWEVPDFDCQGTFLVDPIEWYVRDCEPNCDWMLDLEGTYEAPGPIAPKQSLNTFIEEGEVNISYNSNNDELIFHCNKKDCNKLGVQIYDIQGRSMSISDKLIINQETSNFKVSELPKGVYFVKVTRDGIVIKTEKFLK